MVGEWEAKIQNQAEWLRAQTLLLNSEAENPQTQRWNQEVKERDSCSMAFLYLESMKGQV